jgi:uncharacterized protein DUF3307
VQWADVFLVFAVSHLAGDFLLQTDWQATHKRGGLGRDPIARRALFSHIGTYTLAFVPALIWLGGEIGVAAVGIGALIALPHLVQDDGRLLAAYVRRVKGADAKPGHLMMAVDQSAHALALFGTALLAAA